MNRLIAAAAAVLLSACGGSSSGSATTLPTTVASTASTAAQTTAVAPTTTVALSRDARLAVERCRKALGQFFASEVGALGGGHDQMTTTEALCDEAELQLKADNPPSASVGGQLLAQFARLKLSLAFADLDVLSDKFDVEAQHTLQVDVDAFDAKVDELLGG